jgi:PA14 domain
LTGSDTLSVVVSPVGTTSGDGLTGFYYGDTTLTSLVLTRIDPTVNFSWGAGSPAPAVPVDNFSARWTGFVKATVTGSYTFYIASNDGNRLWVNGVQLTNRWADGNAEQSLRRSLAAR